MIRNKIRLKKKKIKNKKINKYIMNHKANGSKKIIIKMK